MKTESVKLMWNDKRLIPVIVQDRHTGEVRMLAYANLEALSLTLQTNEAHFFSRSRNQIWKKGETSGNTLTVTEVWADCDGDTLLFLVDPHGPSCHTGAQNCFFNQVTSNNLTENLSTQSPPKLAEPTLVALWHKLHKRVQSTEEKSYTKSLLEKGTTKINEKLIEETKELTQALTEETDERVLSETSDLFYHMLVGLLSRKLNFRQVIHTLSQRFSQSGHEEKASRGNKNQS